MKKSTNLYFNNNVDTKEKLNAIKSIGYDEFFTGIYDKLETIPWKEQIEYAKKIGLNCTMIHCSYREPLLNNFWLDNEIGEQVFQSYLEQIKLCKGYTKNFVVHLNGDKNSVVSEIGLNRIRKLLEECEKYDINLCIENLYSANEIPYIFKNIKHKNLKICFDTGHKNFLTPNFNILKEYLPYISVLHIHDNHGEKDEHLILGKGNIDLNELSKYLSCRQDLVLASEMKNNEPNFVNALKEDYKALSMLEKMIENCYEK